MNVYYWSEELCRFLNETFQYDPIRGKIIRIVPPARGPRRAGMVGTITRQGDITVSVQCGGRTWILKAHRLAVFLKTQQQFRDVRFIDGDRLNLAWDNLQPFGYPLTERNVDPIVLEEIRRAKIEGFRRTSYEERTNQKIGALQNSTIGVDGPTQKREYVCPQETGEIERRPHFLELRALSEEMDAKNKLVRYKRGCSAIYTLEQIKEWWNESHIHMVEHYRTTQECYDSKGKPDVLTLEKWQLERLNLGKAMQRVVNKRSTNVDIVDTIKFLKEGTQWLPSDYMPEIQKEYEERKMAINLKYSAT